MVDGDGVSTRFWSAGDVEVPPGAGALAALGLGALTASGVKNEMTGMRRTRAATGMRRTSSTGDERGSRPRWRGGGGATRDGTGRNGAWRWGRSDLGLAAREVLET